MLKNFFHKYKSIIFFRFILAGLINSFFGFSIGIIFLYILPFHYTLSILLATCIGVIFNYFLSLKFVFQAAGSNTRLLLFIGIYASMYLTHMALMSIFIFKINVSDIIAYVISAPIIILLTYVAQKKVVFLDEKDLNSNSNIQ